MRFLFLITLCCSFAYGQTIEQAKKLYAEKRYEEATKLLIPVSGKDLNYAQAQFYLGRIAFDKNQYDKAQNYFESAIKADDRVADYHYWLASTLGTIARDANPFKQGILAPKIRNGFEKTVSLDPQHVLAHWGLIEYYTQAPGFMGGSWEKAEATARSIMKINKADGHNALAVVYLRQEKLTEAENQYVQAYQADAKYRFTLANFYIGQKIYDKAFTLFEDAIKKDPNDMSSVYQIGRTSAISGQRLETGEAALLKYLAYQPKENEPSHGGAKMRLGQILEKKGNKTEAKRNYQDALVLDPGLKEAKEGLDRVSK